MTIPFRNNPEQPTPQQEATAPEPTPSVTVEQFNELRSMVGSLTEGLKGIQRRFEPDEPRPEPEPQVSEDDYFREPVRASERVSERVARRVWQEEGAQAANLAVRTAIDIKLRDMAQQDEEFGAVADDFRGFVDQFDARMLAQEFADPFNPGKKVTGLEQTWRMFRGSQRYQELMQARAEAQPEEPRSRPRLPFVESPSARQMRQAPRTQLSDEQRRMARGLGIPEDKLLEEMKKAR